MSELTNALQVFNNVSLPTLAFFFVIMFLLVIGYLIRGLMGSGKQQLTLLSQSLANNTAIAGVKQDIADALNRLEVDNAASQKKHDETIASFTSVVSTHNGSLTALQTTATQIAEAVNRVNEAVSEIRIALPLLAKQAEMDLAVGRLDEAIKRLEEVKQDCLDKKDTQEHPVIDITPIEPQETMTSQPPGTGEVAA